MTIIGDKGEPIKLPHLKGLLGQAKEKLFPKPAHYLVDLENIENHWGTMLEALKPGDYVHVFYTGNSHKLECENLKACMEKQVHVLYIHCERIGNKENALDFQLSSMLGFYIAKKPERDYVIVSNDNGFAHTTRMWSGLGKNVSLLKAPTYTGTKQKPSQTPKPAIPSTETIRSELNAHGLPAKQANTAAPAIYAMLSKNPKLTAKSLLKDFHVWCQKTYGCNGAAVVYRTAKPAIENLLKK